MKTLEQAQSEALTYTENRIKFWEHVERTGKIDHKKRLSKKDQQWIEKAKNGRPLDDSMDPYLATLAQRKIKALNRFVSNLKKKLGRDL